MDRYFKKGFEKIATPSVRTIAKAVSNRIKKVTGRPPRGGASGIAKELRDFRKPVPGTSPKMQRDIADRQFVHKMQKSYPKKGPPTYGSLDRTARHKYQRGEDDRIGKYLSSPRRKRIEDHWESRN